MCIFAYGGVFYGHHALKMYGKSDLKQVRKDLLVFIKKGYRSCKESMFSVSRMFEVLVTVV